MRALALKRTRALLVLVVALGQGLIAGGSRGLGRRGHDQPVRVDRARSRCPATAPVPIWGFGVPDHARRLHHRDRRRLPGPVLTVNEGDVVTINVTNALPGRRTRSASRSRASRFDPGPRTPPVGARRPSPARSPRARPGTYLYQSGGDAGRQEAMGLYGALIVRSATAEPGVRHRRRPPTTSRRRSCSARSTRAFNAAPDTLRPAQLPGDVLADQRQGVPGHAPDHRDRAGSGCCCAT